MTEITQQAQQTPVTTTQDPAMPTGTQQTPEVSTVVQDAGMQTQVPSQPETPGELPEQVTERTRQQFEKLTTQLRTEREAREQLERSFQYGYQAQQVQQPVKPIYDPTTGLLNENVFSDTQRQANEANNKANALERELARLKEERQMGVVNQERNEAYSSHPELDPTQKKTFNKDFVIEARRIKIDSMINPQDYGNRQLSLKEAGDRAKQSLSQQSAKTTEATEQAKAEGAKQALEQLTPKEQASLEAAGNPGQRAEAAYDHEALVKQTRQGGNQSIQALMQRMQGLKAKG